MTVPARRGALSNFAVELFLLRFPVAMAQSSKPAVRAAASRLPRGRPKDLDKRMAILIAAKALFTAQGLSRTSMEGIAQAAGVSKLTVYSHFRNKEELFRQTIFAKCAEHWPDVLFDVQLRPPLRERLLGIGQGFLDLVNSQDVINMYRLLAAEAGSNGKFGRLFWEAGPERTMQRFSQVLEAAAREGEISLRDARRSAAHFFVLLKGEHHIRCLVGAGTPLEGEARRRHLDEVVDLFLRAHAPGITPSAPARAPAARADRKQSLRSSQRTAEAKDEKF